MKRKVVAAMLSTMLITVASASVVSAMNSSAFTDVSSYASYYKYIEKVVDDGIMNGTKETEFGVSQGETRLEFIESLHIMAKSPLVIADSTFADVKNLDGKVAVIWAENKGLFDGLKDGTFKDGNFDGDTELSRSELAQILYNYAKNIEQIDMTRGVGDYTSFDDADKVSDEYKDALNWAIGNGILVGDDRLTDTVENSLRPNETANKTEVAEALYKYIELRDMLIAEMNATATPIETTVEKSPVTNAVPIVTVTQPEISLPDSKVEDSQISTDDKNKENDENKKDDATAGTEEEDKHEHCLVDNMVSVTHPEEGHYEKELVKEAWTEKVEHEAEYKDVYVKDADAVYNTVHHDAITHEEEVYVKDADAVYNTVHHDAITHEEEVYVKDADAVYNTVHHDAEGYYKDVKVVDTAAWTETVNHPEEGHWGEVTVVDKEAWDEDVYDYKLVCYVCGDILSGKTQAEVTAEQKAHMLAGEGSGFGTKYVKVDTIHHPAETHTESKWIVDKQAWVETINHPEVSHTEKQWVETKAAWDEKVLVTEEKGHYETVTITDKEAWDEQVLVTPEQGHYETVTVTDKEAWDEQVLVTPEQGHYEKELVKDAWTETIEHEAEYEDVWVVDVAEWVENVKDGMICTDCGTVIR